MISKCESISIEGKVKRIGARFKAIEIADMFIQLANDIDDSIDNLKLNKMLL